MQLAEVIENTEDSSHFSRIHIIFLGSRDFLNFGLIEASSSNNRDDSVYCMVNLFHPGLLIFQYSVCSAGMCETDPLWISSDRASQS